MTVIRTSTYDEKEDRLFGKCPIFLDAACECGCSCGDYRAGAMIGSSVCENCYYNDGEEISPGLVSVYCNAHETNQGVREVKDG